MAQIFPGVPIEGLKMDWGDLADRRIFDAYPSGMTSSDVGRDLSVRMTDFGRRFIAFITIPGEGTAP